MSSAMRAKTPRPTPTPIPIFAPVLRPLLLESSELLALSVAVVGVEMIVVVVGVPLISVDAVVVSAAVEAGEDPLLPLPLLLPDPEPCVSDADSVLGR
jgi:hypothetical protein